MKPILYVLCGIPGAGKSYFADHFDLNAVRASRDHFRLSALNKDDEYFSKEDEIFPRFTNYIAAHLKNKMNVIADATHITPGSRRKLLTSIDSYGFTDYNIIFIYFSTSYATCCSRNEKRTGRQKVPADVLESMHNGFRKPTMNEDERCIGVWQMRGYHE